MNKNIILLVEDDKDDQVFAQEAFEEVEMNKHAQLHIVEDGEDLFKYLDKVNGYQDRNKHPLPHIILLDLNLPKKDGRVSLQEIKKSIDFKHIPVIVFTTSSLEEDIKECYYLGANSYIVKPDSRDDFNIIFKKINCYWFNITTLPKH